MNRKTIAALTLSLFALTNVAQAADYYVVAPMTFSGSGVQSDSSSSSSLTATLNETTLPVAYVNEAYSYDMKQLLVVTGDEELDLSQSTWEAVGALPDGMVLGTNGVFAGTPTSASPSEGTAFTVKATYKTASDEQVYYLQINFPVSVALASATLPTAQVGQAYSYDFKQLMDIISDPNENPSLAEFSAVTALPAGLTLGVDGVLSGTPTQDSAGASFTIRVHYKTAMAEHTYNHTVTLPIAVSLAEATLPAAQVGQAYTYDMAPLASISNDSDPQPAQVSFEAASALPAGLTLSSNGMLSGTPTTADPASSFTVMVTYKTAAAQRTYAVEIKLPIAVSLATATLPDATAGQSYSYDLKPLLTISNDPTPEPATATWEAVSALPAGLSLGASGVISGTPTTATSGSSFTARVTYKTKTGEQSYTIVVNINVTLASAALTAARSGVAYSYDLKQHLTVTGETPNLALSTWASASTLPAGLSLSTAGVLSGTPTDEAFNQNTINFTATYKSKSDTKPFTLVVNGVQIRVTQVAGSLNHTCAVRTDGGVSCWGVGGYGQLGNGSSGNFNAVPNPVSVTGLTDVVKVATSGYGNHTCALKSNGTVWCWGMNNYGILGDGTGTMRTTPVQAINIAGATDIAAGANNTCAVTPTATYCWGNNQWGQLGNGTTTSVTSPQPVTSLGASVAKVSIGSSHICVLTTVGGVKCAGYNSSGQLGDGTSTNRYTFADVSGLTTGVAKIVMGENFSCALTSAGAAKCWGTNGFSEIGHGVAISKVTVPTQVSGLSSGVVDLGAGGRGGCAVLNTGAARCWGNNQYGQIGDGTTTNRSTPVAVSGLSTGVASVNVGDLHACGVLTTGALKCWGMNQGKLGDGTSTNRSTPVFTKLP